MRLLSRELQLEKAAAAPFLTPPCDFRTMNGDANAISWGTDAALLRYRKNSVVVCTKEERPLNSEESLQQISKGPLILSFPY